MRPGPPLVDLVAPRALGISSGVEPAVGVSATGCTTWQVHSAGRPAGAAQ